MDVPRNAVAASQCRESDDGERGAGRDRPPALREAELQCLVRDANEVVERLNDASRPARPRKACGASAAIPAATHALT